MSSNELDQIEQSIQQSRKVVDLGESLERLLSNRDFKKVIAAGYFENEAIRLVHLKADPAMQKPESQQAILVQMDAIGALAQYLQLIRLQAAMSNKNIVADEQAREDILAEGV